MGKKVLEIFKVSTDIPENGFVFVGQVWHYKAFHGSEDSIEAFDRL